MSKIFIHSKLEYPNDYIVYIQVWFYVLIFLLLGRDQLNSWILILFIFWTFLFVSFDLISDNHLRECDNGGSFRDMPGFWPGWLYLKFPSGF